MPARRLWHESRSKQNETIIRWPTFAAWKTETVQRRIGSRHACTSLYQTWVRWQDARPEYGGSQVEVSRLSYLGVLLVSWGVARLLYLVRISILEQSWLHNPRILVSGLSHKNRKKRRLQSHVMHCLQLLLLLRVQWTRIRMYLWFFTNQKQMAETPTLHVYHILFHHEYSNAFNSGISHTFYYFGL